MNTRSSLEGFAFGAAFGASIVWVAACGSVASTGATHDVASDAGDASDAGATFPDAGAFCSGAVPRMIVNGAEVDVLKATGKGIALNCCDSAELTVATSMFQAPFDLLWRLPAGPTQSGPVDLAHPPMGFSIELDLGCDPSTASCASGGAAEERFTSGFQGSLQYVQNTSTASYCLTVAEDPASPHPSIHSLQLFAPNVVSSF